MAQTYYRVDPTTKFEVYPEDGNGRQIIAEGRYANTDLGNPYYPKDENYNEYKPDILEYIQKDGKYILPKSALGMPIYPEENGVAVYPQMGNDYIFGVGTDGHEYYAKLANKDEFYPPDNSFATNKNGSEKYAKKNNGDEFYPPDYSYIEERGFPRYASTDNAETVFPVNNEGEYYLGIIDPTNPLTLPTRYARKTNNDQIYPKRVNSNLILSDYVFSDYAILNDGSLIYPKDIFNNEFYKEEDPSNKSNRPSALPDKGRYAVTNDLRVILPEFQNTYYIDPNFQPTITGPEVLGRLKRDVSVLSGYVTSQKTNVAGYNPIATEYEYEDLSGTIKKITPLGATAPIPVATSAGTASSTTTTTSAGASSSTTTSAGATSSTTTSAGAPSSTTTTTSAGTITSTVPFYSRWYFWVIVIVSLIIKMCTIWWFFLRNQQKFNSINRR